MTKNCTESYRYHFLFRKIKVRLKSVKNITFCFVILFSFPAVSDIHFIGGEENDYFAEFKYSVKNELTHTVLNNPVYVSIGSNALESSIRNNYYPLIATHITKDIFEKILAGAKVDCSNCIGAVFWEPDLHYQIELAKKIFPSGTIYVLTSNPEKVPTLERIKSVKFSGNLLRSLRLIRSDAVALVAIPNPNIYTPKNLRVIIRSLYLRKIPVIGYTENMVEDGSLASANTSLTQYSVEVSEVVNQYYSENILTRKHTTPNMVYKNPRLARSLGIVIPDDIIRTIRKDNES